MLTALVATAVLTLCGCTGLAALARRPGVTAGAAAWADTDLPVALVSLVVTNCSPGADAYEATVIDLAARGFLAVDGDHERLRIRVTDYPGPRPGSRELTDFELRVFDATQARLTSTKAAPFNAVADNWRADVRRIWEPFEAELLADARRRGLCGPRLTVTARSVTFRLAASAGLAGTAFVLVDAATIAGGRHPGIGLAVICAVVTLLASWGILGGLGRKERLTAQGLALATRWKPERASLAADPSPGISGAWLDSGSPGLRVAAFAVAAGLTRRRPISAAASQPARGRVVRRTQRPSATQRPPAAWSAFSGTWRLVEIKPPVKPGMGGASGLLGGAIYVGAFAYGLSMPGGIGPLSLIVGCAAAGLAIAGMRVLARVLALPKSATCYGQVIARWAGDSDADGESADAAYLAVDDGKRAWALPGSPTVPVALGDLVQVTYNPRTGGLKELTVTSGWRQPELGHGSRDAVPTGVHDAALPLLTEAEAAELVGPVVRRTPVPSQAGHNIIVKGRDATLSLIVTGGGIAALNTMICRRAGIPLAGVGDEAWLLNRQRTVVARVGTQIIKLTVNPGSASDSGQLPRLAAIVAARLPAPDTATDQISQQLR